MPLYVIHALDKPGRLQARLDAYPAHRAYLGEQDGKGVRILGSGPLESEDGSAMIGSCFIVEAEDIAAVRAFNAGDPFVKADVWANVSINRYALKRGPFAEALPKA